MAVDAQCQASIEAAIGLRPKKVGDPTISAGSDHSKRKIREPLFVSNIRIRSAAGWKRRNHPIADL